MKGVHQLSKYATLTVFLFVFSSATKSADEQILREGASYVGPVKVIDQKTKLSLTIPNEWTGIYEDDSPTFLHENGGLIYTETDTYNQSLAVEKLSIDTDLGDGLTYKPDGNPEVRNQIISSIGVIEFEGIQYPAGWTIRLVRDNVGFSLLYFDQNGNLDALSDLTTTAFEIASSINIHTSKLKKRINLSAPRVAKKSSVESQQKNAILDVKTASTMTPLTAPKADAESNNETKLTAGQQYTGPTNLYDEINKLSLTIPNGWTATYEQDTFVIFNENGGFIASTTDEYSREVAAQMLSEKTNLGNEMVYTPNSEAIVVDDVISSVGVLELNGESYPAGWVIRLLSSNIGTSLLYFDRNNNPNTLPGLTMAAHTIALSIKFRPTLP